MVTLRQIRDAARANSATQPVPPASAFSAEDLRMMVEADASDLYQSLVAEFRSLGWFPKKPARKKKR